MMAYVPAELRDVMKVFRDATYTLEGSYIVRLGKVLRLKVERSKIEVMPGDEVWSEPRAKFVMWLKDRNKILVHKVSGQKYAVEFLGVKGGVYIWQAYYWKRKKAEWGMDIYLGRDVQAGVFTMRAVEGYALDFFELRKLYENLATLLKL